jgi:hypothetical protein
VKNSRLFSGKPASDRTGFNPGKKPPAGGESSCEKGPSGSDGSGGGRFTARPQFSSILQKNRSDSKTPNKKARQDVSSLQVGDAGSQRRCGTYLR